MNKKIILFLCINVIQLNWLSWPMDRTVDEHYFRGHKILSNVQDPLPMAQTMGKPSTSGHFLQGEVIIQHFEDEI